MATSRRVGNYATSANAVIRNSDAIFDAAMSGKPDFTKISKEAIKGRSLERRAVTKAEGEVAAARIRAARDVKGYGYKADALIAVGKQKGKKARMAGVLGGLGALAGGFVIKKGREEDKKAADKRDSQLAEHIRFTEERFNTAIEGLNDKPDYPAAPTYTPPKLEPYPNGSGGSGGSSGDSGVSQTGSTSVSQNISAQHSFDSSKQMNREQITALAQSVGFSPEASQTVYGIAGGESGFDPTNSTKRSGLYAKTGEDSVGLMQINWGYHKDKGWLQNMGITSREQLLDPVTNMKAAKYLYDGRGGGFQDWTVYNKGIYKSYL